MKDVDAGTIGGNMSPRKATIPRVLIRTRGGNALRHHVKATRWWRSYPPQRLKDFGPDGRAAGAAVALTFDDGPHPVNTPAIARLLAESDVRGVFFMCGAAAEQHPDVVRAVSAEGHVIGGHTWDHRRLPTLDDAEWARQVDDTHELLADLTGRRVRCFRPPGGKYDRRSLRMLARRDITPVLWSVSGRDWVAQEAASIARTVLRSVEPSDILLLHDACGDLLRPPQLRPPASAFHEDRWATVAALPQILTGMQRAGLRVGDLPERSPLPRRLRLVQLAGSARGD